MQNFGLRAAAALTAGFFVVSALTLSDGPQAIAAPQAAAGLEGTWSGAGSVRLPTGDIEKVRCKATFAKRGSGSYSMTATCATASVRVQQFAVVAQTSPNRYIGNFENLEYGITGTLHITVKGRSMNAAFAGGGSSATVTMTR